MSQTKAQLVSGLSINASAPATAFNIDASGRCGIGTTSPTFAAGYTGLHLDGGANGPAVRLTNSTTGSTATDGFDIILQQGGSDGYIWQRESASIILGTAATERARIDSSGRLLVGTSSARSNFYNTSTVAPQLQVEGTTYSTSTLSIVNNNASGTGGYPSLVFGKSAGSSVGSNTAVTDGHYLGEISFQGNDGSEFVDGARITAVVDGTSGANDLPTRLVFSTTADGASSPTERMRIDSSGRVGIGKTPNVTGSPIVGGLQLVGGANLFSWGSFGAAYLAANAFYNGTNWIYQANNAASLYVVGDGTHVWSRAAGGTAGNTATFSESARIDSSGNLHIAKTTGSLNTVGFTFYTAGLAEFVRSGGTALNVNRLASDGGLVDFYQDSALEGNISVSGTTVFFNGAHLARWSQLANGAQRVDILRGSVLSNLDEMCEWGEEANEQLNRMKISDVDGDPNVAGVFISWDDDDDTYTDDFYCAMTGDFIIRIAEGVTVQRGDLLMSAGDGTAKPQDDDIIRSKTVAKVTSTHVTCTYEDGSYCVPCVLMAC
jgi:hypothetical protein